MVPAVPRGAEEAGIDPSPAGGREEKDTDPRSGSLCTTRQSPEMELEGVGESWAQVWLLLIVCALTVPAPVLCWQ